MCDSSQLGDQASLSDALNESEPAEEGAAALSPSPSSSHPAVLPNEWETIQTADRPRMRTALEQRHTRWGSE